VDEVILGLLAETGRQVGEQVDEDGDGLGVVGADEAEGGAEADGGVRVLEQDADGGDVSAAAGLAEDLGGGAGRRASLSLSESRMAGSGLPSLRATRTRAASTSWKVVSSSAKGR